MAQRSRLTIAIADHERELIRRGWKCNRVDVVPMSVSSETVPVRSRRWVEDGALKLLHLGATHSLASFSSLEFLLRDVWPLLPASSWATVSLAVAGAMGDDELTTRIKQLAAPFPNVLLIGYQADLARLYSDADVQVIGTTRATGLRTRIVESFAYGLPVLSTAAGAKGIEGLRSGENILIGQSPSDFAEQILSLVHAPYRLARIAARARATYVSRFSRSVVARRLEVLLDRYVLSDG